MEELGLPLEGGAVLGGSRKQGPWRTLNLAEASSREVERHLPDGEGTGGGAPGGEVLTRYSRTHLDARQGLRNQAGGVGLSYALEKPTVTGGGQG